MTLNVLTTELRRICDEHVLAEKWVVAPSLRAGHEWLFAVVQSGGMVANARVKTLAKLALDLAAPEIAKRGLELASARDARFWSIGSCTACGILKRVTSRGWNRAWPWPRRSKGPSTPCAELTSRPTHYLATNSRSRPRGTSCGRSWPNTSVSCAAATGSIRPTCSASRSSGSRPICAIGADVLVLIPSDIDASGLAHRFLDRLPAGRRIDLPVDKPGTAPAGNGQALRDAELLRWLPAPTQAPPPARLHTPHHSPLTTHQDPPHPTHDSPLTTHQHDGSASIFRAVGEVNEVRRGTAAVPGRQHPARSGRGPLH